MSTLCTELQRNASQVAALWDAAVEAEPWLLPRQHARSDFVPDIVTAIAASILCEAPRRASVLLLAETAARHATARAQSGADHSRIVLEYYLLRNALWSYFRARADRSARAEDLQAILYVDIAVSLATRAALLGYYRREFEAQGTWDGALERLVDESPPMWHGDWERVGPTGLDVG